MSRGSVAAVRLWSMLWRVPSSPTVWRKGQPGATPSHLGVEVPCTVSFWRKMVTVSAGTRFA